jgi:hypothetical protein
MSGTTKYFTSTSDVANPFVLPSAQWIIYNLSWKYWNICINWHPASIRSHWINNRPPRAPTHDFWPALIILQRLNQNDTPPVHHPVLNNGLEILCRNSGAWFLGTPMLDLISAEKHTWWDLAYFFQLIQNKLTSAFNHETWFMYSHQIDTWST